MAKNGQKSRPGASHQKGEYKCKRGPEKHRLGKAIKQEKVQTHTALEKQISITISCQSIIKGDRVSRRIAAVRGGVSIILIRSSWRNITLMLRHFKCLEAQYLAITFDIGVVSLKISLFFREGHAW
jgi:hypothetical protein